MKRDAITVAVAQAGGLCYRRGDARDMGGGPSVALY